MIVNGISIDSESKAPVLVLRVKGGSRILPIWIGPAEAGAISAVLSNMPLPRPLTHDLMATLLHTLNISLSSVRIAAVRDGVFYAELNFLNQGFPLTIDCRPSDAVALALRVKAPLYAEEAVLREAGREMSEASFLEGVEVVPQDNMFADMAALLEGVVEKETTPEKDGAAPDQRLADGGNTRTVVLSREESEDFLGKLLRALEPESKYKM